MTVRTSKSKAHRTPNMSAHHYEWLALGIAEWASDRDEAEALARHFAARIHRPKFDRGVFIGAVLEHHPEDEGPVDEWTQSDDDARLSREHRGGLY